MGTEGQMEEPTQKRRKPKGLHDKLFGKKGWKKVTTGTEQLLDGDEGGFAGLEILDADDVDLSSLGFNNGASAEDDGLQQRSKTKEAKKRKRAEKEQADESKGAVEIPRVQPAKKVTRKKGRKHQEEGIHAASKAKAKKRKKAQTPGDDDNEQENELVRDAAIDPKVPCAVAAQEVEEVDVSAWGDLDLHPLIYKAVSKLGFESPTPIQSYCLAAAIQKRKDVVGAAQTGSGKTLAFGIPILQLLLEEREMAARKSFPSKDMETHSSFLKESPAAPQDCNASYPGLENGGSSAKPRSPNKRKAGLALSEPESPAAKQHSWPASHHDSRSTEGKADAGLGLVMSEQDPFCDNPCDASDEIEENMGSVLGDSDEECRHEEDEAVAAPRDPSHALKALILTPTRELALQVCKHLQAVAKICGIWVVPIVGGLARVKQERLLNKNPSVVVATPGRLWEYMREGHAHLMDLSQLRFFVIDEADKMAKQGSYQELSNIIKLVPEYKVFKDGSREKHASKGKKGPKSSPAVTPLVADGDRKMQTFIFSATLTLPQSLKARLRKLAKGPSGGATLDSVMDRLRFRGIPEVVDLTNKKRIADKLEESFIICGDNERDAHLYYVLVRHPGRTLIFTNTIAMVRRVAAMLQSLSINAHPIHAQQQQRQRLKSLDRFKDDPNAVMVATDVAARGLDIPDVRCVIHHQIPVSADAYIHRSGRAARAGNDGVTILLVIPKETLRFHALFKVLERPIPAEFPVDLQLLTECKQRAKLARELYEVSSKLSNLTEAKKDRWVAQAAEALEVDLDEDSDEDTERCSNDKVSSDFEKGKLQAVQEHLRQQLSSRLIAPLQRKINKKFFAGGYSALPATDVQAEAPHEGDVDGTAQAAVALAVSIAERFQDSKHKAGKVEGSVQDRRLARQRRVDARKKRVIAKLPALIDKGLLKYQRRQGEKRSGLVVIPQMLGREASGPDALQALRKKLGK
ncbi:unnamed protein product [Ostreobium quekettii]|uniref:RNA helicase n=1 Tax=Ostreobium quekettii TaxID=121088 RepID=A0A8S1IVB2_9CHLO|nr:unnamed protein product [Ostreobium quekettii]|eukprot:evm.model.scf_876.8 EVM.evm.TU.scf_876.8   scf_876:40581-48147(-)